MMNTVLTDPETTHRQAFSLANDSAYQSWRACKLAGYPAQACDLIVPVNDLAHPAPSEQTALRAMIGRANMAIAATAQPPDKAGLRLFGKVFGLARLDHNLYADEDDISALRVVGGNRQGEYIPYTNRALNWHTDGYYNRLDRQVHALVLCCIRIAAKGGINQLLDPEMVYILLRDQSPEHISALMQPDAMTIPANIEDGVEIRPAQGGPVFSIDETSGTLHMRYTARTRSIEWKPDRATRKAVAALEKILNSPNPYILAHRLAPGECLICNNVLHNRSAFSNDTEHERLMYRGRYFDRINEG